MEAYGYVGGNPLNATDPTGYNKCEVGVNPLRWGGNAVDCVSKLDPSVAAKAVAVGAAGVALAASAPVTVTVAAGIGVAASITATTIDCRRGDGCVQSVAGTAPSVVSAGAGVLAVRGALAGLSASLAFGANLTNSSASLFLSLFSIAPASADKLSPPYPTECL